MIEFPMVESSIWTSWYCLIFYLFIILISLNTISKRIKSNISLTISQMFVISLIISFVITHCIQGDFFHLMWKVYDYDFTSSALGNYEEKVYVRISEIVDRNYFLFRVIVFGGACALYTFLAKRLELNVYIAMVLLAVMYLINFAGFRFSLAAACYYYGLSFICKPMSSRLLSIILGILLIVSSVQFHDSAIALVIMTVMLLVPMRKWFVLLSALLIPVVAYILRDMLHYVMAENIFGEQVSDKMSIYSDFSWNIGVAGFLMRMFEYGSIYVPFFICLFVIFSKRKAIPSYILNIYKIVIGLILFSAAFVFMEDVYMTFYFRILYMCIIPLCVITGILYQNKFLTKRELFLCVIPGLIFNIIRYLYDIYLSNLGIGSFM